MGYDVHLLATCLLYNLVNSVCKFKGAVLYRKGRLVVSVVNCCTVFCKLLGNSAPVVKVLKVTKENTVYQKYGVLCLADFFLFSPFVQQIFFLFKSDFLSCYSYDFVQGKKVCNGNPSAQKSYHPVLYTKLNRGGVNEDYTVPEYYCKG